MSATVEVGVESAGDLKEALHLPETAEIVDSGGRECLLVPVADFLPWLEDQIDGAVAMAALEEPGPRIPWEEVERRLDMLK